MITKYYAIGGSFVLSVQIGAVHGRQAVFFQFFIEPFRVFAERCPVVRNDSPVAAGDDPASRISAEP